MKLMNGVDEGLVKKGCRRGEKTFDTASISDLGVSKKKNAVLFLSDTASNCAEMVKWCKRAPMNTSWDQMHMPDIRDSRLVYHLDNSFDICVLS